MKKPILFFLLIMMAMLPFSAFAQCFVSPALHTPVSNVNAVITAGYETHSSVSVSATGGLAPLVYSIIEPELINYPGEQSIYSFSNNKLVSSEGIYQVRIKDASNNFFAKTAVVGSPVANRETTVCPASITASVTTTDADCPSSGSATISVVEAGTFTCTLLTGPSGATLNAPQLSKVFNALLPGNYTAEVSCLSLADTISFTIHDNYAPISNISPMVTASCGGYTPGGTVNISVTGGSAPFVYSIIQSNDPNYSDTLSVYNSNPNKTVSSFGNYQVRVKDACNQFYTTTVQLSASLNPVTTRLDARPITSCNPTDYTFGYAMMYAGTYTYIDFSAYNALGGVKVNFYEQGSSGCAPTGPLLFSFVAHASFSSDFITLPAVSSKKYFIQLITPCGDTTAQCYDATDIDIPYFRMSPDVQGCGSSGDPLLETISVASYNAANIAPLTVELYRGIDASGILVGTKTAATSDYADIIGLAFTGLIPGPYFMRETDACGHVITQIIDDPSAAGPPSFGSFYLQTNACTNAGASTQSGTATVVLSLTGYLPGLATAKAVIISGPGSIGDSAYVSGNFIWNNLLPGTYTAAITTSCGTTNLQFAIPYSPNDFLKQNVTATGSSACSSGSGAVITSTDYNGPMVPNYVLTNATTNAGVDSNATGLFSNVIAGAYYVRLKLYNGCLAKPGYYVNSNTVTIIATGAGPQILKKSGITCEDTNGNPLGTGTAYVSIAGASPLLVEYKLASSSVWITWSSDAATETAIPGLIPGSIYDIRVTSCGITNATLVTIEQAGPVNTATTQQPCAGSPYELDLPQLAGASYEWKNAAGAVVSTTYNYTIASYNNSYNGMYTGTISWGGCVKRIDTVVLNSSLCGGFITLPVTLTSFTGKTRNCETMLNWRTAETSGINNFIIERSANGRDFTLVDNVSAATDGNYGYTDQGLQQGILYYRLRMIGTDGRYQYSNTIKVNAACNSINTQWSVYPTLVQRGSTITIKLNSTDTNTTTVSIVITSVTGQRVHAYDVQVHSGQNIYTLPDNKLVSGTYLVCVYDNKLLRIGGVQKLVYSQ